MIEERIANALADIRLELFRGNRDLKIIDDIAAEYDLKPSVLAQRLTKAYGSLEELDSWQTKSASMRAIETRMKDAIYAYAETDAGVDIGKWLEERAGRAASGHEVELADELWIERTWAKMTAGQK